MSSRLYHTQIATSPNHYYMVQMPRQDHQERTQEQSTHVITTWWTCRVSVKEESISALLHGGDAASRSSDAQSTARSHDRRTTNAANANAANANAALQPRRAPRGTPSAGHTPQLKKASVFPQPNFSFSGDSEYSARIFLGRLYRHETYL